MGKHLSCVLGLAAILCSTALYADDSDNELNRPINLTSSDDVLYHHQLSLGWLLLRPRGVNHGLDVSVPNAVVPSAQQFNAEDVTTHVGDLGTPGLFYSYAIDNHWGVELFGGVPPIIKLYGNGVINAPITILKLPTLPIVGNVPGFGGSLTAGGLTEILDAGAGANNPIATGRAWTPTIIFTYHLFDRNALIRPYVGIGPSYGFLTQIKVNPNITQALNAKAAEIVLLTGDANAQSMTVKAQADPFFTAVGTLGTDINLTRQIGIKLSATYIPSSTTVRLKIYDSVGQQIGETSTKEVINPWVFFMAVSYRFNL